MSEIASDGLKALIACLDDALTLGRPEAITARIKGRLAELCCGDGLLLPQRLTACRGEAYARRLLHRAPRGGYTVVVMTWGPGQGTPLHDHAGLWCVECVVEGQLEVTQYDLREERGGRFRFHRARTASAGIGDAGSLIPPHEYHVLANPREDRKAVTLHVYGGEMDRCNVYEPLDGGWWRRSDRALGYHA